MAMSVDMVVAKNTHHGAYEPPSVLRIAGLWFGRCPEGFLNIHVL